MKAALFVYGTLVSDELLQNLRISYNSKSKGILKDYCKKKIAVSSRFRGGPALTHSKDSSTAGYILTGVSKQSFELLDFYEGLHFERKTISVESKGKKMEAQTYVWKGEAADLSNENCDSDYLEKAIIRSKLLVIRYIWEENEDYRVVVDKK
jgi:gamma-glutamylcyclotransferase (GGCT)/AIG2-like uncharacterized protein YtfP